MRQLTEEETKTLFSKLAHYTGRSLNSLIAPTDGGQQMVFRLQGSRVRSCHDAQWPGNTLFANVRLLGILHAPSYCESRDLNSSRQPPVGWYSDGKVHKDRKVQTQLDLSGCRGPSCEI